MSVFVNQGLLTLTLETGIDLTTASLLQIKYKSPAGTRGTFAGTLVGTTKIKYDFVNDEITPAGMWSFQSYVEIGGLKAYGNIVSSDISKVL